MSRVVGPAAARPAAGARKDFWMGWGKWIPAVVVLLAWELGSGVVLDPSFFSSPSATAKRLVEDFANGRLIAHTVATYGEVFGGYAAGVLVGAAVGYASGMSTRVAAAVEPYALVLNAIPKVAIAPLMIIWFGIGPTSKLAMAALMVFFLMFFNVFLGVRAISNDYLNLARIMGARPRDVVFRVVFPYITPYVITGLKQSIVFAVIGALIAEFIASSRGIGYYIQHASGSFDATGVFAGVAVVMALVIFVTTVLNAVERRYLKWMPRRK